MESMDWAEENMPTECMPLVYESTAQNSPLRRLFSDCCAYEGDLTSGAWFDNEDTTRKDFMVDVIHVLFDVANEKRPAKWDFHQKRAHYYVEESASGGEVLAGKKAR